MLLRDVLKKKSEKVVTVPTGTQVIEAVRLMVEKKIGAILVVNGDNILGVFTERDHLRATATGAPNPGASIIDDHMVRDLVIGLSADTIELTMAVMTEKRIRHVPILEEGKLIGIVSIGDLVKAVVSEQAAELRYLKDYISGGIS
ncbi:MAG TPA: CBS domain-containing protein [Bacteroidetes bacterium]|nr:hypoxic response protein 1 [bacterium BMS3Bbin04]HDO66086.1 CBS domain-containing protein [Bacteroidota bacterium]HEX05211.1 CBS domain-containing protein [Bacteroidota bacterium]